MKLPAKKPAPRRPPRKVPPITEKEVLFCHLVLKGVVDPKATQIDRIEAAGAKVGFSPTNAAHIYNRKPVQAYLATYRERLLTEMVRNEVRELKRAGYTREDVLTILHDLAHVGPEKTKGSIAGQVAAAVAMSNIMGLVVAPRDPDSFFKGRSEEEIAHFAEHGSFAPPVVM